MCKYFLFPLKIKYFFHLVLHIRSYINNIIVMYASPIVLHVKRWISNSYSQCWKGFKYAEDAGKVKNVQERGGGGGGISEEQQTVELLRTNERLMNNYHKNF